MKTTPLIVGLGLVAAWSSHGLLAADWPRLRGADGSGIAADAHPPVTWSDAQGVKWKAPLPGPGSSSPIVRGDRVFVTCYSGYGDSAGGSSSPENLKRHLVCLARQSGKILWSQAVPATLPEDSYSGFIAEHGYASNTPAVDDERVYAFFGKTGVVAFDFAGKQLWLVNVGKESSNRRWGSGSSLILYKDFVIVTASEESRSIRALDKRTGKEIWKAAADTLELTYGTPTLVTPADGPAELVIAVPSEVWSLNPDTGKLRWYAQTSLTGNVGPSVVAADGIIYAMGGFPGTGSVAVRAGGKGDVTQSHLVWSSQNGSYIPSPVVYQGRLHFVNDQGFAVCLDAKTGKLIYKERLPGAASSGGGFGAKPFYASAVLANGNLYAMSRRNGLFVIAATPEFKLVGQNKLAADGSDFNATPALSGNQIFLRSNRFLYCIEADAGGRSGQEKAGN
jgi:outer membrane protein assembly factor BamB